MAGGDGAGAEQPCGVVADDFAELAEYCGADAVILIGGGIPLIHARFILTPNSATLIARSYRFILMPITPFHFGPAAIVHAVAPKHVSFLAFCAANVLIDVEPLYYMLQHEFPLHRFFHTYVGATGIVLATVILMLFLLKLSTWFRLPNPFHWQQLKPLPIMIGAALGSYSHIVLDSVMHDDIRPFAPWSAANPLLGMISLNALHVGCVMAGAIGYIVIEIRKTEVRRKR